MQNILKVPQVKGKGKEGAKVSKTNYVRLEVGGVAVERSVATIREAIRAGEVPAVRSGKLILVDLEALRARFAARPVEPGTAKAAASR